MTKTKEELNKIKEEYETLTVKLKELTEDELKAVTGGNDINRDLDIIPSESNIGTTPEKNAVPGEIKAK